VSLPGAALLCEGRDMARPLRIAPAEWIFHVLNRANGRGLLFESDECYRDFLHLVLEARSTQAMRVLAYCLMPNHWHFVLQPRKEGDLSKFVQLLASDHAQRWHRRKGTSGRGHLYQDRFKSIPVSSDRHLLTVLRYVEANPLRAGLVLRAEDWRWSSFRQRLRAIDGHVDGDATGVRIPLEESPVPCPSDWRVLVNDPGARRDTDHLREQIRRGRPFGDKAWSLEAAVQLQLQRPARPRGRPRKHPNKSGSDPAFPTFAKFGV
jgi:putative transposase